MKKIQYKVTNHFGDSDEGDIVDAYILIQDVDSGVALIYHPKSSRYTCASIELCIENKCGFWVTAGNPAYINIDSQKLLNELAKNTAALTYRRKEQTVTK